MSSKSGSIILKIYFALTAFVTLMMTIFAVGELIDISIKTFIFTEADTVEWYNYENPEEEPDEKTIERRKKMAKIEKQQSVARDVSMLIVAAPLFLYHFSIVRKEWEGENKKEEKKTKS